MSGVEAFCCFTHTAQSLGHSFPALRRARVGFHDVLLGPRPSLPHLRRGLLLFVRQVHSTVTRSDSSGTCLPAVRLTAFSGRSRPWFDREVPEVSRFSCMLFLSVRRFSDYAGPTSRSRLTQPVAWPSLPGNRSASLM